MRRLRKYLALSPAGRAIVLRSLFLLPVVAARLRVRGMERTRAWLDRRGVRASGGTSTLISSEIAFLVGAAASLLRARCLSRSLVLWHFLRDCGARVEVRLGVSKLQDGSLCAHAWVELDGLPFSDGPDVRERFAVLPLPTGRFLAPQSGTSYV